MTGRLKGITRLAGAMALLSLITLAGCKGGEKAADSPESKAQSEATGKANAAGQAEMYKKKMQGGK